MDKWVAEFSEIITISVPTKVKVGSNTFFWCLFIKVNNFIFARNSLLWPASTGLDRCVVGYFENIAISAPY